MQRKSEIENITFNCRATCAKFHPSPKHYRQVYAEAKEAAKGVKRLMG